MTKEERDRIELTVPDKALVLKHARCPNGCDLMDAASLIHGNPAILLAYEFNGRRGALRVDPVYGSHDNIFDTSIPKGAVIWLYCPHCGASLEERGGTCECAAPMFVLHLPEGGYLEACQRVGCFNHRLRILTKEAMMQKLFDDLDMDSDL